MPRSELGSDRKIRICGCVTRVCAYLAAMIWSWMKRCGISNGTMKRWSAADASYFLRLFICFCPVRLSARQMRYMTMKAMTVPMIGS